MKTIILLLFALSCSQAKLSTRAPASLSSMENERAGCIKGLAGSIRKYNSTFAFTMDDLRKECDRLITLTGDGPDLKTDQEKLGRGCGVAAGAYLSSIYGQQEFYKMVANKQIDSIMEEICLK